MIRNDGLVVVFFSTAGPWADFFSRFGKIVLRSQSFHHLVLYVYEIIENSSNFVVIEIAFKSELDGKTSKTKLLKLQRKNI